MNARYTNETLRSSEFSARTFLAGIALALTGVAVIALTALGKLSWPLVQNGKLYLLSFVMVAAGSVCAAFLSRQTRCVRCGAAWSLFEAYFPVDSEATVRQALEHLNFKVLSELPPVTRSTMKMQLSFHVCEGCKQTGSLELALWQDYRTCDRMHERFVEGRGLRELALVGKLHEEYRDQVDDD